MIALRYGVLWKRYGVLLRRFCCSSGVLFQRREHSREADNGEEPSDTRPSFASEMDASSRTRPQRHPVCGSHSHLRRFHPFTPSALQRWRELCNHARRDARRRRQIFQTQSFRRRHNRCCTFPPLHHACLGTQFQKDYCLVIITRD